MDYWKRVRICIDGGKEDRLQATSELLLACWTKCTPQRDAGQLFPETLIFPVQIADSSRECCWPLASSVGATQPSHLSCWSGPAKASETHSAFTGCGKTIDPSSHGLGLKCWQAWGRRDVRAPGLWSAGLSTTLSSCSSSSDHVLLCSPWLGSFPCSLIPKNGPYCVVPGLPEMLKKWVTIKERNVLCSY